MYDLWFVLRVILYIPLFSCSGVWFGILGFVSWCNVFSLLEAMPMFVCFNKFVIFLIFGLWWVIVVYNFWSFFSFG